MSIHLTTKQLNEALHSNVYESNHGRDGYTRKKKDFGYLLVLQGDEPESHWTWTEKAIDYLVQACQPPPSLTHAEIFLLPDRELDETHFATYLSKDADWGSSFAGGSEFYLGTNMKSWRAVPIFSLDASHRLRVEAQKHVGTPYGNPYKLYNYPFAAPPFRVFASWIDNRVKAPAHCASLTARCIARALPELQLPHCAPWFGPSTLFLELTKKSRMEVVMSELEDRQHLKSVAEVEEVDSAMNVLLRGSDDAVRTLDTEQCEGAIEKLSTRVIAALVSEGAAIQRLSQHQLAIALLRYAQVNRRDIVHHLERVAAIKAADAKTMFEPNPTIKTDTSTNSGAFR